MRSSVICIISSSFSSLSFYSSFLSLLCYFLCPVFSGRRPGFIPREQRGRNKKSPQPEKLLQAAGTILQEPRCHPPSACKKHALFDAVTYIRRAPLPGFLDRSGQNDEGLSKCGLPGVLSTADTNGAFSRGAAPCIAHLRLLFPIFADLLFYFLSFFISVYLLLIYFLSFHPFERSRVHAAASAAKRMTPL